MPERVVRQSYLLKVKSIFAMSKSRPHWCPLPVSDNGAAVPKTVYWYEFACKMGLIQPTNSDRSLLPSGQRVITKAESSSGINPRSDVVRVDRKRYPKTAFR